MEQPQTGELWNSPSGVVFEIVDVADSIVTVDTRNLHDGAPSTLTNEQTYTIEEMHAARGWEKR